MGKKPLQHAEVEINEELIFFVCWMLSGVLGQGGSGGHCEACRGEVASYCVHTFVCHLCLLDHVKYLNTVLAQVLIQLE